MTCPHKENNLKRRPGKGEFRGSGKKYTDNWEREKRVEGKDERQIVPFSTTTETLRTGWLRKIILMGAPVLQMHFYIYILRILQRKREEKTKKKEKIL